MTEAAARELAVEYFASRFGIDRAAFDPYRIVEQGPSLWLVSRAMPAFAALRPFEPQNPGVRLLRRLKGPQGEYLKPTSFGLAVVGAGATRNAVDLSADELWAFLGAEPVRRERGRGRERERFPGCDAGGYVAVRFEGHVLGCGLLTAERGLVSQVPEAHGRAVRTSLFLAPRLDA